jgi:hypothetical protein
VPPKLGVGRHKVVSGKGHARSPSHNIQEHSDAVRVGKLVQFTNQIRQRSVDDADFLPYIQIHPDLQYIVAIAGSHKRFDNPHWRGRRAFVLQYDADYSNGAVDAAPAFALDVEVNEEVAREKRPVYLLNLSRMTTHLLALRQEDPEILIL